MGGPWCRSRQGPRAEAEPALLTVLCSPRGARRKSEEQKFGGFGAPQVSLRSREHRQHGTKGASVLTQLHFGPMPVQGMRLPSMSFASKMHTLSSEEDKARATPEAALMKEVPKVPMALAALPAKPTRCATAHGSDKQGRKQGSSGWGGCVEWT